MKWSNVILNSILATALAVGAIGCDRESRAKAEQQQQAVDPVPVVVGSSRVGSFRRSVEVVGTLFGDEETTVSAKVPGRVTHIYKDVGDRAGEGEALMQIDKTDYELGVNQKKMAVQAELSKLGLTDLPEEDFDPSRVPTVEKAKLQTANAEAKFNRAKQL